MPNSILETVCCNATVEPTDSSFENFQRCPVCGEYCELWNAGPNMAAHGQHVHRYDTQRRSDDRITQHQYEKLQRSFNGAVIVAVVLFFVGFGAGSWVSAAIAHSIQQTNECVYAGGAK